MKDMVMTKTRGACNMSVFGMSVIRLLDSILFCVQYFSHEAWRLNCAQTRVLATCRPLLEFLVARESGKHINHRQSSIGYDENAMKTLYWINFRKIFLRLKEALKKWMRYLPKIGGRAYDIVVFSIYQVLGVISVIWIKMVGIRYLIHLMGTVK